MSSKKQTGPSELTAAVAQLVVMVDKIGTKVDALERQSAPAEIAGLKRFVHELAEEFLSVRGITKAAIDERERERQHLVRALAVDKRVPFSAYELETKPIEELRKLADLAQGMDGWELYDWKMVRSERWDEARREALGRVPRPKQSTRRRKS